MVIQVNHIWMYWTFEYPDPVCLCTVQFLADHSVISNRGWRGVLPGSNWPPIRDDQVWLYKGIWSSQNWRIGLTLLARSLVWAAREVLLLTLTRETGLSLYNVSMVIVLTRTMSRYHSEETAAPRESAPVKVPRNHYNIQGTDTLTQQNFLLCMACK